MELNSKRKEGHSLLPQSESRRVMCVKNGTLQRTSHSSAPRLYVSQANGTTPGSDGGSSSLSALAPPPIGPLLEAAPTRKDPAVTPSWARVLYDGEEPFRPRPSLRSSRPLLDLRTDFRKLMASKEALRLTNEFELTLRLSAASRRRFADVDSPDRYVRSFCSIYRDSSSRRASGGMYLNAPIGKGQGSVSVVFAQRQHR